MWVLFSFQIELSCGTKLKNLGIKAEGKGPGKGGVEGTGGGGTAIYGLYRHVPL